MRAVLSGGKAPPDLHDTPSLESWDPAEPPDSHGCKEGAGLWGRLHGRDGDELISLG